MFKQKFIPFLGAALLAVGCGGAKEKVTTVDINIKFTDPILSSDYFSAKKGQKFKFTVDFANFNTTQNSPSLADQLTFVEERDDNRSVLVNFVNLDKKISISCNNKAFKKTDLTYEEWSTAIDNEGEKVDHTYFISTKSGEQIFHMYNFNEKPTDKYEISLYSAIDIEKVCATFHDYN